MLGEEPKMGQGWEKLDTPGTRRFGRIGCHLSGSRFEYRYNV